MTTAARGPHGGRSAPLAVGVRTEGGRALLGARGELVHGCADTLAGTLAALPPGTARVDLDASEVVFLDTAGLTALVTLREYGRRRDVPVSATGWRGQPRRVLELMGLDPADPLSGTLPTALTDRAASAVAQERAEQLDTLRLEIAQLRHAIDSRPVIDQARGILMAAHTCTPDQAWEILREASQRTNTKLRQVASAVTASAAPDGTPPPEPLRSALAAAVRRVSTAARAPRESCGRSPARAGRRAAG
ncbi:ANTAR domain-containing protein [Streptomyces sp. NPDC038707]|uniref:Nitrate regulatory protein n=1 Tax=Streptomyces achromogenes subsp. streptozoticus TaxID=285532 RepID=A0A411MRQ3_STRC2|nr:nitrate regulatory protein [Streptomyces achromogenes subsp. streptozoticus]